MTDSHQLIEAWLAEGAIGDPPRELAVHATVCASCARRIGAFDSLAAVNVAAAGSPPPLTAPSPIWLLLARGRAATTIAATVAAGILVVFGASQLIGSIGPPEVPGPSQVAVAMTPGPDGKPVDGHGPQPAEVPASEPPSDPIASFVPLPSASPNEPPLAAPNAPFLASNGVGYYTVGIRWTERAVGGPAQKWELWRQTGSGSWVKLGELPAPVRSFTNGGLAPGTTYSYRVRAVNLTGASGFSNTASATTLVPPTAAPTPTASPTASPTPEPPTPEPTPAPTPTPTPDCSDNIDNDGDNLVDWPADPGCSSTNDPFESPFNGQCNDGADNDGDGFVDLGDPACSSGTDPSEAPFNGQCNDGADNDGDGFVDLGDPACSSGTDPSEFPFNSPPTPDPTPVPPTPEPPTPEPPTPEPPTPEPPSVPPSP